MPNYKSTIPQNAIPIEIGKMPPQAIELEEAILGAIMLEKDAILKAVEYLKPESFYKDSHQKIFQAIIELNDKRDPIDILTVTERLKVSKLLDEVGGPYYVAGLTQRISNAANIEYHSMIVADKFMKRELIRISSEIQNSAFDESTDVADIIEFNNSELIKLTQSTQGEVRHIKDVVGENLKQIEAISKEKKQFNGIPSGLVNLDKFTCGWQNQDLIIIAARPSMGKTAFALHIAKEAAKFKHDILLFSLEMSNNAIGNRVISSETGYTNMQLKTGRVDNWNKLEKCLRFCEDINIWMSDISYLTISKIRSIAYTYKSKHNIGLIVVDYLQLMAGKEDVRKNREQEIADISRNLKILAKELNIPVIALSQLNRDVERRSGDKRPMLADLRESGAIEQDADVIMFLYCPEKYGILEDEKGNSTIGLTEVIIEKQRNGAIGTAKVYHNECKSRYFDNPGDKDNIPSLDEPVNINKTIEPNHGFSDEPF